MPINSPQKRPAHWKSHTPIVRGGASYRYNWYWPTREHYANYEPSDWTEPGTMPTYAYAIGFNPLFLFSLSVRNQDQLHSQTPNSLSRQKRFVGSWCLSYRKLASTMEDQGDIPPPVPRVLFMTYCTMINIWNEQLITAKSLEGLHLFTYKQF